MNSEKADTMSHPNGGGAVRVQMAREGLEAHRRPIRGCVEARVHPVESGLHECAPRTELHEPGDQRDGSEAREPGERASDRISRAALSCAHDLSPRAAHVKSEKPTADVDGDCRVSWIAQLH